MKHVFPQLVHLGSAVKWRRRTQQGVRAAQSLYETNRAVKEEMGRTKKDNIFTPVVLDRGDITLKWRIIFKKDECHLTTVRRCRFFKFARMEDKNHPEVHNQYHGCWLPGETRRQGISRHEIDLVWTAYSNTCTGVATFWQLMEWCHSEPCHQQTVLSYDEPLDGAYHMF